MTRTIVHYINTVIEQWNENVDNKEIPVYVYDLLKTWRKDQTNRIAYDK